MSTEASTGSPTQRRATPGLKNGIREENIKFGKEDDSKVAVSEMLYSLLRHVSCLRHLLLFTLYLYIPILSSPITKDLSTPVPATTITFSYHLQVFSGKNLPFYSLSLTKKQPPEKEDVLTARKSVITLKTAKLANQTQPKVCHTTLLSL